MADDSITISPGPQFKTAMLLALAADILQLAVFPLFVGGALSPADDILDLGMAALLTNLLGWHWEFLPSFFAKLVPGVDLVPFWTIAVVNVWRKAKRDAVAVDEDVVVPALEHASGKTAGRDFGVCFNPEFLREGSSIADFDRPPFTLIGGEDDDAAGTGTPPHVVRVPVVLLPS